MALQGELLINQLANDALAIILSSLFQSCDPALLLIKGGTDLYARLLICCMYNYIMPWSANSSPNYWKLIEIIFLLKKNLC